MRLFVEWLKGMAVTGGIAIVAVALAALVMFLVAGCASMPVPPPVQPPQPPGPIEIKHEPLCVPPGLVSGCWHQPPGSPWIFNPPAVVPVTKCPKELAPGAFVTMGNKPYGQGFDSSPLVVNDPDFCYAIHGVRTNRCHLEGWPKRAECELELFGKMVGKAQACPVWEFSVTGAPDSWQSCKERGSQAVTCDHFGNTQMRDDPQTDAFEGEPKVCGEQRDPAGDPNAGFFMIGHGTGFVRACTPDHKNCSDGPLPVDW